MKKILTIGTISILMFCGVAISGQEAELVMSATPVVETGIVIDPAFFDFGSVELGVLSVVNDTNTITNISSIPMALSVKTTDAENSSSKTWVVFNEAPTGLDQFAIELRLGSLDSVAMPKVGYDYGYLGDIAGEGSDTLTAFLSPPSESSGVGSYSWTMTILATEI